ncbi:LCP family protein [Nocardioides speluncae]|uniref:LCP family protein n=1 Tax=Nocardioides speluncae TaxID=2670337 RepID=UPI000D69DF63|nr:LCP family protein [Nocardioides speluncae]
MIRTLKTMVLGVVLAVTALTIPDSEVQPADMALVDLPRARGVDLSPDVIWIMAVGSDARAGQSILHSRGDALQLIGINTRTGAATVIGIPRDSWVNLPGRGSAKINEATISGGPRLMAKAVSGLVGIEADYAFMTGFGGFERLVNSIGGITVRSRFSFSDPNLRPRGFRAGKIKLDGRGAHAFSRIRKSLPGGDFDRSANQQRTLRGIQARIRGNAHRPGFIEGGVLSVMRNLHTNLTPARLYELAQAVAQVDPRKLTTCVIPGGTGYVGAASVVFPSRSTARRYGSDARRDATLRRC